MSTIRIQGLCFGPDGTVTKGSASIVESKYVKREDGSIKNHSTRVVIERLGKVIWVSADQKSGIFNSPTRGVVSYDSESGSFSRVDSSDPRLPSGYCNRPPQVHAVFGDVYLLLEFLVSSGMADILKRAFPDEKERELVLCHLSHTILKDGGHIHCDDFISKTFLPHVFPDIPLASLESDSPFFAVMGDDRIRMSFFTEFVSSMRRRRPDFGRCAYVDSTPLPNSISSLCTNAPCSHGVESTSVQTRLVIVLDKETGLPVWFQIVPGNVLDFQTTKTLLADVEESLGIRIEELVLDAGYVSKELLQSLDGGEFKSLIARMPAKKGYPYRGLFHDSKGHLRQGRYTFVREGHTYFGYRKPVVIFGFQLNAYVYVDWVNAQSRMAEFIEKHEDEYSKMTPSQLDWLSVEHGYFVLISEKDLTPKELLDNYFLRTSIETFNKTEKEYLDLLPLSKWDYTKVRGKILSDIISSIALILMRKKVREGKRKENVRSMTSIIGKSQSLMCFASKNGTITVESPNKQTKEAYKDLGITIPAHLKIADFRKRVLAL